MKINLIEYIKKAAESTTLSTVEQEKLDRVVTEYMAMKPLRGVSEVDRARLTSVRGSFFSPLSLLHINKKYMPIAIIIALILSGSASYAAEGSVPGDLFYPMKVSVNENVGSALAFSLESKAAFEAKIAERRLAEAAKLASDHKLTGDVNAKLSKNFAGRADLALAHTKELEKKNASAAIGLASNFESNLDAHESVLAQIDTDGDTNDLRVLIRQKALLVSKLRMNAEGNANVSAESKDNLKENKGDNNINAHLKEETAVLMGLKAKASIREAQSLLTQVGSKLESATSAKVTAQIDSAVALSAKGDAFLEAKNFSDAFHSYQWALVTTNRLTVYLKAPKSIDIKILFDDRKSTELKSNERTQDSDSKELEDRDESPRSMQIFPFDLNIDGKAEVKTDIKTETKVEDIKIDVGGSGSGSIKVGI